jgi:hypothetical protein
MHFFLVICCCKVFYVKNVECNVFGILNMCSLENFIKMSLYLYPKRFTSSRFCFYVVFAMIVFDKTPMNGTMLI